MNLVEREKSLKKLNKFKGGKKMEMLREIDEDYQITAPEDCLKYVEEFRNEDREYLVVLGLDTRKKVTFRYIASVGTLDASISHPREIFKKAIINSSDMIIVVHNHPSGGIDPSDEDIDMHRRIEECGKMLEIRLLDALIVTKGDIKSFKERL